MICKISGTFMEQTTVTKKDGSTVPQCIIYSDGEVVKINNFTVGNLKQYEPVEATVRVLNGQYGLYVTAV